MKNYLKISLHPKKMDLEEKDYIIKNYKGWIYAHFHLNARI